MLSKERRAELDAEIQKINEALTANKAEEQALRARKNELAREVLIKSILPSLHWTVQEDGESLVADERVGIEVLILFGARFYHEKFNLTDKSPTHPDRVAHNLLAWLREKNLLAFGANDDPAMFALFQATQSAFSDEVVLNTAHDMWAQVDDTRLTLYALDVDRLLAFVEEHHLTVNWQGAETLLADARARAEREAARSADLQARLARFVSPKVQGDA